MAASTPNKKARLTAEHAYCVLLGLVLLAGAFHLHEVGITILLPLEQSAGHRGARAVQLAMANRSLSRGTLTAACGVITSCVACISSSAHHCTWEAGRCVPGRPAVMTCPSSGRRPSTANELAVRLARAAADAGVPMPQLQVLQSGAGEGSPGPRPPAIEVGASHSQCARRKPYHVVLTAASGVYQEWQTRIAYYHYRKLKARQGQRSRRPALPLTLTPPKRAWRQPVAHRAHPSPAFPTSHLSPPPPAGASAGACTVFGPGRLHPAALYSGRRA